MGTRIIRDVTVVRVHDRHVTPSRRANEGALDQQAESYTVRAVTLSDGTTAGCDRLEPLLAPGSRVSVAIDAHNTVCAVINHTSGATGTATGKGLARLGEVLSTLMFAGPMIAGGGWLLFSRLAAGGAPTSAGDLVPMGFGVALLALGGFLLWRGAQGDDAALAELRRR